MRIVVVGAGIVGLSCAFWLLQDGHGVTVLDRDPSGDKASFGNAGTIAMTDMAPASAPGLAWRVPGWLMDPLGPLSVDPRHLPRMLPWRRRFLASRRPSEAARIASVIAALNARAYEDLEPLLAEAGLSGELHRTGALSVYETEAGQARDAAEWALRRQYGILCEELDGHQAREIEPALGPLVTRAVFTPQWSHVSDPRRIVDGLRGFLEGRGLTFQAMEARAVEGGDLPRAVGGGRPVEADRVVIAAGAWSARLAATLGDRALLESERGYNATLLSPGVSVGRQIIFAERKFVAAPLSIGLRIGGAAEFAGLEAPARHRRSEVLVRLAARYLPGLNARDSIAWMGHRPPRRTACQ